MADYDVNRDASRQEMRTYVCGQCHVEYYFKGDKKRLTYPWAPADSQVDSIFAYYEANGHKDWTHARSGRPGSQGAASRVRDLQPGNPRPFRGGLRGLPHAVRAPRARSRSATTTCGGPLLNIDQACQTCHKILGGGAAESGCTPSRTAPSRPENIAIDALLELIGGDRARPGGRQRQRPR